VARRHHLRIPLRKRNEHNAIFLRPRPSRPTISRRSYPAAVSTARANSNRRIGLFRYKRFGDVPKMRVVYIRVRALGFTYVRRRKRGTRLDYTQQTVRGTKPRRVVLSGINVGDC